MHDFIYQFILSLEYASTCLLMFIFPSEVVMPVVGYAASLGHISLLPAILSGAAGVTLWAIVIYMFARYIGYKAIIKAVSKYGKFLGISTKNVDRAGKWFDRHAGTTVFVSRFLPGLRTAVSIPAGLRRMPFGPFVAYTALGSCADSTLLAYAGYKAHVHFGDLMVLIEDISSLIILGLCILGMAFAAGFYYRKKI